jgi:tubulin-like protein CetZ
MLRFGFIGIGQVGGLFADEAKRIGYPSLSINTASLDLESLSSLEANEKIHLIGYEGAGKDRSIGEEAFLEHQNMIVERVKEGMDDCHVIFPIFAIGGGTGSGMAGFMTRLLTEIFDSKVICPILFLPDEDESLRTKMNALESFGDISTIEEIGATFMIDNQRVLEMYGSLPLQEKYQHSRIDFLQFLHNMNEMTKKHSGISNLDSMDLLTVLSERGQGIAVDTTLLKKEIEQPKTLGEKVEKLCQTSIHVPNTMKHLTKSAIAYEVPKEWTTTFNPDRFLRTFSVPLETFNGIYSEQEAKLYALFTGLPYPNHILNRFEETIKQNEKHVLQSLQHARTQTYDAKHSWTNTLKRKRKIKM